jgi:2-iminoacetate synthase
MVKIIAAGRLLFPRAGINLSTRESPEFRDRAVGIGVTKMSAGSVTSIGGYAACATDERADEQFEVHDRRSVAEIKAMLKRAGLDPVVTDWRNIVNE